MNEVQIFTNQQFGNVRTVMKDGEPWFVAADVCRVLEHSNSRMALARLDEDEKGVSLTDTLGGKQEMAVINESGLYTLVIGSRKPEARAFKRWITREVIPALRKHGIYATDSVIDQVLADPDYGIRLLSELKHERQQRRELEAITGAQQSLIAELLPKATYYDIIMQNPETVPVTIIAKDYGMSGRAFNALLHQIGVQYKLDGVWVLYQVYARRGYTHSRTEAVNGAHNITYTTWTQSGRRFLYDMLRAKVGLLPKIERGEVAIYE